MIQSSGLWPVATQGPNWRDTGHDTRKFYRLGQALVQAVGEFRR